MSPKVLIFGTGSLGAVYAWVLSKAVKESDITAICRSNYEEASKNGFTLHSNLWGNDLKVRPKVVKTVPEAVDAAAGEPYDYIVVTSKAIPTKPSTAELIRPAVTGNTTTIVLIQNGIGIEDEFSRLYPSSPLLSTVAYLPATQVSPGVVHHKEVELLHIGTYPASAPAAHKAAARAFRELVVVSGASAKLHDDVQFERWSKLLVNGAWNPICALTRLRDVQFIASNDDAGQNAGDTATEFVTDVMREIAATARAYGYDGIDEDLVQYQMGRARARVLPGVQPSMLADALEGRMLEADAIVGNAVRLAREKGVSTPMLRAIYLLAGGLSRSFELARTA